MPQVCGVTGHGTNPSGFNWPRNNVTKEFILIIVVAEIWDHQWKGVKVTFLCDNMTAVTFMNVLLQSQEDSVEVIEISHRGSLRLWLISITSTESCTKRR